MDWEYFVPSLKMWPTSMPRLMWSVPPFGAGEGSPSRAVATSTTPLNEGSDITSRGMDTFE